MYTLTSQEYLNNININADIIFFRQHINNSFNYSEMTLNILLYVDIDF